MDKRQQKKQQRKQNKKKGGDGGASGSGGQAPPPPTNKRATLPLQKRNELNALIKTLLEIGFRSAVNNNDDWQQYLEIHAALKRVMILEAQLKRPSEENTTPAARLTQIETFYKWMTENGALYDGVEIAEFDGYELGLRATRDISKDDQLFAIPRKLMLTEENLVDRDVHHNAQLNTMSNLKLSYTLMLESLKLDGFWQPYVNLLPERYNNVLYFTVEEMEQLRGSNVFSTALKQCKAIARQYAFIYNYTQNTTLRVNKDSDIMFKDQYNYELYRWAVSTVMTRENMIPRADVVDEERLNDTVAALIPFWDMANHRDGHITSYYNVGTQQMESGAQDDFKQGEQIFIHYGERSNGELLVHNGFINPTNPKDSVGIKLGFNSSDPLFVKRSVLHQMLHLPKNYEFKVLPAPNFISSELLAFVRIFNMNDEQLDHWIITQERATDLLHMDCALETALETKTWNWLHTRLMLLVRCFPTTLVKDEEQLKDFRDGKLPSMTPNTAMILEYRIMEKRILLGALDYTLEKTKG